MSRCLAALAAALSALAAAEPQPTIAYTPLSDAARAEGALARYADAPRVSHTVETGKVSVRFSLPTTARAYDVIPIDYETIGVPEQERTFVEAVAFEDPARAGEAPLHDMAIPGDARVKIEYLGHVCADYDPGKFSPLLAADSPPSDFPPIRRDAPVRSAELRPADMVWFKVRVTNVGDTVLDPEGLGGVLAHPTITRLEEDGTAAWTAGMVNLYARHLGYLYPGEHYEEWVSFWCPKLGYERCHGLTEGRYRLDYDLCFKYHREWNWGINIWGGMPYQRMSVVLTVKDDPAAVEPEVTEQALYGGGKTPGYLASFEEFMTSFNMLDGTRPAGTLFLQVAPWTEVVTLKLITTAPKGIAVVRVPVEVTGETLSIQHNPENVMLVDGAPAVLAMPMPGMRSGFQLGPYPEDHLRERVNLLKDLGVNLISCTAGDWWHGEFLDGRGMHPLSETFKFWYDTLMREAGMKCLAWSVYPPTSLSCHRVASKVLGSPLEPATIGHELYANRPGADLGDPVIPEMIAACTRFNTDRWGDLWFRTTDGRVPVDIEDTWGWMRDDINLRYLMGDQAVARFQAWVREKYGDIASVNAAWGSDYPDFEAIRPQVDQGTEVGADFYPVYNRDEHPFHDWSPALEDWDRFRTALRCDIYAKANALMQAFLPGAELSPRTEGAIILSPGDARSGAAHARHIYYAQRRNALVYDVLREKDVIHFFSDYTTLPYTPAEWREGLNGMARAGIVPMFLPQYDRMRDIVLNPHYGRDYQRHYNLDAPTKGVMLQPLQAAYPLWKITYAAGGVPGIIWSDYLCDGFATETQQKELRLLREHLDATKPGN